MDNTNSNQQNNAPFPPYARHCNGFDPSKWSQLCVGNDGKQFWYLSVDLRLKWAQIYCEEKNIVLKPLVSGPQVIQIGTYFFLYREASVFFDGELIAQETSGFPLQEGNGGFRHDHAIQTAGTMALGRALRNAGFATVGGSASELGEPAPSDGGVPASFTFYNQNELRPQPSTPPVTAPYAAPAQMQQPQPAPLTDFSQEEQPQQMTLEQAKASVIPNGTFAGKTMGELFTINPQQVAWWAQSGYIPNLKQAAQVIMDNLLHNL